MHRVETTVKPLFTDTSLHADVLRGSSHIPALLHGRPYRHWLNTDTSLSLLTVCFCPWGKKVLKFSLNSTYIIRTPLTVDTDNFSVSIRIQTWVLEVMIGLWTHHLVLYKVNILLMHFYHYLIVFDTKHSFRLKCVNTLLWFPGKNLYPISDLIQRLFCLIDLEFDGCCFKCKQQKRGGKYFVA